MFALKCIIATALFSFVSGKRSFTLVLDTTYSMKEEIRTLRTELRSVLNAIHSNNVDNFILVPYNDPEVAPPRISYNPEGLISEVTSIAAEDGHECPESSVTAIQEALQVSHPESFIFVFTDAYANDANKFDNIVNLCKHTRSQVNIFLSGYCVPTESSEEGSLQVYFDIAKVCSGTVFRMEPLTSEAFKFVKEIVKVEDWAEIITYGYEPAVKYKEFTFSVDQLRNEVIIVANGKYPRVDIRDKYDQSPDITKIIDDYNSLVLKLTTEQAGEYRVSVRSRGSMSVTFYRKSEFPFSYGFSTKVPHSIKETSLRPMPEVKNYIFIQMKTKSFKVIGIELQTINSTNKIETVGVMDDKNGLYIAETFIDKEKSFKINILVEEVTEGKKINVTTKILTPQRNGEVNPSRTKPISDIIASDNTIDVKYGSNVTIPCKVTGYPKPEIKWEDEKSWSTIETEEIVLEIPNVFISYVTINNVDQNRTLFCKAKNSEGEVSSKIQLNVFRPYSFDVVRVPTDSEFEYGAEGRINCEVNAYPPAEIKWYHNDTLIITDNESNFVIDDAGLTIKNMTLDDAGEFKCEASNGVQNIDYTVEVTVSGVEAPKINIKDEIVLTPGEWKDIECKIFSGKPEPKISWKYKPEGDYLYYDKQDFPDGVVADGANLKIGSAKIEHNGAYICQAENIIGIDRKEMVIKVHYAPIISNNQPEHIEVMEETIVSTECEVDAVPEANVKWEFYQSDQVVPFDDRKTISDNHTLRFIALWNDSGSYHCVAENSLGKTEKVVDVNVLVRPYIQPQPDMICAKTGESVNLNCNIMYGNPAPTTKWEFIAHNSTSTVLYSGSASSKTLHLNNVKKSNEGTYVCMVENSVGYDYIQIIVKVE